MLVLSLPCPPSIFISFLFIYIYVSVFILSIYHGLAHRLYGYTWIN